MYKYTNNIYYLALMLSVFINSYILKAQFNTIKETKKTFNLNTVLKEIAKEENITDSIHKLTRTNNSLFNLPLDSIYITSPFGIRYHPFNKSYRKHYGIDLRGKDIPVYSITTALVKKTGYDKALGIHIILISGNYEFIYGHLSHIYVKEKDLLKSGEILGRTGTSGLSTAKHLHFAIKKNKHYIDPLPFLEFIMKTF